ncbi:MAG: PqiC family protein [Polyangiaceae bacterium]
MSRALRHLFGVGLFATCALATGACSRSADPVFYALAAQPGSAASLRPLKIELRRPGLPRYLDRPQIVRHAADERLDLSSSDHWASPLDEMVAGTVSDDLALRLPSCTVYVEGGAISVAPDVLVEIELSRFEETAPGTIELVAQVAVRFLNPVAPARLSRHTLRASTADRDTSQLVARLSALLGQLSDAVAEQVVAGSSVELKSPRSEE